MKKRGPVTPTQDAYTAGEFAEMLGAAAKECKRLAVEGYLNHTPPEGLLFYVPGPDRRRNANDDGTVVMVPSDTLMTAGQVTVVLLRDGGHPLADVRLSPFGVTEEATVIDVDLPKTGPRSTGRFLTAPSASAHEPFVLCAPAVDDESSERGRRIRLPFVEQAASSFSWNLPPEDFAALDAREARTREACVRKIGQRLAHGFVPSREQSERLAAAARRETDASVRQALVDCLSDVRGGAVADLYREWAMGDDEELRAVAYAGLRDEVLSTVTLLLERLTIVEGREGSALLRAMVQGLFVVERDFRRARALLEDESLTPLGRKLLSQIDQRISRHPRASSHDD